MSHFNLSIKISQEFDQAAQEKEHLLTFHSQDKKRLRFFSSGNIFQNLQASGPDQEKDQEEQVLMEWLGSLRLLYGVPLNYLVVDEKFLPPESIRFFYMDNNWIKALISGACSIGGDQRKSEIFNKVFAEDLHSASKEISEELRSYMFKEVPKDKPKFLRSNPLGDCTGFLLRSEAVMNWPGLEVDAWERENLLEPLRIEKLSSSILLCLFKGKIDKVALHLPAEDLHFGFEEEKDEQGEFYKSLRNSKTGDPIPDKVVPLHVSLYRDKSAGVLKIAEIAKKMALEFAQPPEEFSSDKFALQMVVGVDTAYLENKQPD